MAQFTLKTNSGEIVVDPEISKHLKAYQRDGIKFMFERCFQTDSGCILAHYMGLGKTLQTITLLDTVLKSTQLNKKRVIIVCPKSTLYNWKEEFKKWLTDSSCINVCVWCAATKNKTLREWSTGKLPSVLLINYEAYRMSLKFNPNTHKRTIEKMERYLLKVPDIVVLDEGHRIKTKESAISLTLFRIETKCRIILSGTPLQNNLNELHTLVKWVDDTIFADILDFRAKFVNPIRNGQVINCSPDAVSKMQRTCKHLYDTLNQVMHSLDSSYLTSIPTKKEFTIFLRLSEEQMTKYNEHVDEYSGISLKLLGTKIFGLHTELRKIWTPLNCDNILDSHKLQVLFEILAAAKERGDKTLVFSPYTQVLDLIERTMVTTGGWDPKNDYFRLDGSVGVEVRQELINKFNANTSTQRVFLISAHAGKEGINLTAANVVVLFDVSWNPQLDNQSICRAFRMGQTKQCYVYRLVCMNTMEWRIYTRSVTKEAMSLRVIGEKNIARMYT